MKKFLKASYTVEASYVFVLIFVFIFLSILYTYKEYNKVEVAFWTHYTILELSTKKRMTTESKKELELELESKLRKKAFLDEVKIEGNLKKDKIFVKGKTHSFFIESKKYDSIDLLRSTLLVK